MRVLLVFASVISLVLTLTCPDQYQLMEGKCIRSLFLNKHFVIESELPLAREDCAQDGGHLPIIKSEQENESFKRIVNDLASVHGIIGFDYWLVMDLVCNSTRRLEWADGTPVIYTGPYNQDFDYDCLNSHYTVMDRPNWAQDNWEYIGNTNKGQKTVVCVVDTYEATSPRPTIAIPTTSIPLNCPYLYRAIEGKCIRPLSLQNTFNLLADMPGARRECANDGAHLPIIKSDDENAIFNNIVDSLESGFPFVLMDFVCNATNRLMQWADDTPVTYKGPSKYEPAFDTLDCGGNTVMSRPVYNDWLQLGISDEHGQHYTVLCVIDDYKVTLVDPLEDQCGGYELMQNPTDEKKPCFKVFEDEISWDDAQQKCEQDFGSLITINSVEENKYFARTAVSYGAINGIHIGVHQSKENPSIWYWMDEEIPVDDADYTNFMKAFPFNTSLDHVGECSAMFTRATSAEWTNQECFNTLPFICRRIDYSMLPKSCPTVAPKAGEDIFPPGFPNSDTSCSYVMNIVPNKLVELEVVVLRADDTKDFLEILEGFAGTLIANLTGSIMSTTKFTTAKSNVMRVNWKPNGMGSGRGFRIRYNEIDAP